VRYILKVGGVFFLFFREFLLGSGELFCEVRVLASRFEKIPACDPDVKPQIIEQQTLQAPAS
jgi:hypothetical protein